MRSKTPLTDRRTVLTSSVIGVVALAGCSALPMWDDDGEPTPTETPTPVDDGVPDADPDADAGDAPEDFPYPDGYAADGVVDPDAATQAHVDGATANANYIFAYDSVIEQDGEMAGVTVVNYVDNESETAIVATEVHDESATTRYYEDDTVYVRQDDGEDVTYASGSQPYEMSQFTGTEFVAPLLDAVEYGDAEVVETDEGEFLRYTSESVTDPERIVGGEVDEDRIDRFDVSIVVDENGLVRGAGYTAEADRNLVVELSLGEIGATHIDRPEWIDEAESD